MATRTKRSGRRHPLATVALIAIGLAATGGVYAAFTSSASAEGSSVSGTGTVDDGKKLYEANCATCHGLNLQGSDAGPSLIGVGGAAVDFQVGTGRMPAAASGPQAQVKPVQFTQDQVDSLVKYVESLSPGPDVPSSEFTSGGGNAANGLEIFRTNCAMCHNVAGAGGALTQGKYAPSLKGVTGVHIYEAMLTGPQNMPVFNDLNLTPQEKQDVITYLDYLDDNPSPGGYGLEDLGPVSEGLFIWIFGLGAVIAVTVWLTARSN